MNLQTADRTGKSTTNTWELLMAPASGTLIKYDLPPRLGKGRSIALEVEKNSRSYRIRVRDYSRDKPVVAKTLALKCPIELGSKQEALNHIKNYPEVWLTFLGIKEELEAGNWPGELRQGASVAKGKKAASRVFPHGSLGHVVRWYLSRSGVGSDTQKLQFADYAREIITTPDQRGEAYGHIDVSDLTISHVEAIHIEWMKKERSQIGFRNGCVLISTALNRALNYYEETGACKGPGWGSDKDNPFNTLRNNLDRAIREESLMDDEAGPDPFQPDECSALIAVMRGSKRLNPYWPLVGLLMATGARPREILALQWKNVLGIWEGHTTSREAKLLPHRSFDLSGECVLIERSVNKFEKNHWAPSQRFKPTKNRDRRIPLANTNVPEYPELLRDAIMARIPGDRSDMQAPEWRETLVFQGPRAKDPYMPFDWHNMKRYWKEACLLAGVRYRKPYQLRHTYVSLMRKPGGHEYDQIAGWIGDTPQTMRARYLGLINGGL